MNEFTARKQYRVVGLTIFIISAILPILRIMSYYVSIALIDSGLDAVAEELILDTVFSLSVQVFSLFLFPLLMYKFVLKKGDAELMNFSGYRKVDIRICLLSFLLGLFVMGLSYYFSVIWQMMLILLGFTPSGGSVMPSSFEAGYFFISVLLTAVLPAICEEFTNRGGFLTTIRGSFSETNSIILIAVAFGLFHQNITQFFYTAMMGALLALLTFRTGSILPAMIVHFTNNFASICLDHLEEYVLSNGFFGFLSSSMGIFTAFGVLCIIGVCLLAFAILWIAKKKNAGSFYTEYNASVARTGFVPSLADNAFFLGAIATTTASTVITFIFGL